MVKVKDAIVDDEVRAGWTGSVSDLLNLWAVYLFCYLSVLILTKFMRFLCYCDSVMLGLTELVAYYNFSFCPWRRSLWIPPSYGW